MQFKLRKLDITRNCVECNKPQPTVTKKLRNGKFARVPTIKKCTCGGKFETRVNLA